MDTHSHDTRNFSCCSRSAMNSGTQSNLRSSRARSMSDMRSSNAESRQSVQSTRASRVPHRGSSMGDFESRSSNKPNQMLLEDFVKKLQASGLDGPVILVGEPAKIGEGGQFFVYKQKIGFAEKSVFSIIPVAVKRPKFPENPTTRLNLADKGVRSNLHHVFLEIQALTDERLRQHQNIVRLLAWSIEEYKWNTPLALVFELAFSDLGKFLDTWNHQIPLSTRALLSEDIAAGLDAIHDSRFVHGDLKPANVLLFREERRLVAKLADFGFTVQEGMQCAGGTDGWQAPEDICSLEADRFSYGLVVWSIFLRSGASPLNSEPRTAQMLAMEDLDKYRTALGETVFYTLRGALHSILQPMPHNRPARVSGLLRDIMDTKEAISASVEEFENPSQIYGFVGPSFHWEVPALSGLLLESLYLRFRESRSDQMRIRAQDLLAMALHFTDRPPRPLESKKCIPHLLEVAAGLGCKAAQALVPRALSYFEELPGDEAQITVHEHLKSAVCAGSTFAKLDLKSLDAAALQECEHNFHSMGGYNLMYWNITDPLSIPKCPQSVSEERGLGYGILHWLAAFGVMEDLIQHLDSYPNIDINTMSANQETPLYVACVRGAWLHAEALLNHGADPKIRCTAFRISCLHWAFSFSENTQERVVKALVKAGADVNSSISSEVPFPHYPFVLPAGSPLHWAVSTSSHNTIRVLIEQGSDPLIRNGCDPYMYDDRIRTLSTLSGPNQEAKAHPELDCHGLSPLDLAAIHRDPFIFETLERCGCPFNVDSADEEGFTALHRLSHSQVFRTSRKVTYSPFPFRSGRNFENLVSIISIMKSLGGDIEMLTSSAVSEVLMARRKPWEIHSYTPLMLAMLETDYDLVKALITCGADVNTENCRKETALMCLSHRAGTLGEEAKCVLCVQLLVSERADVNHHSTEGKSPILNAAHAHMPDVFAFLLSKGADIDEREPGEGQPFENGNVFASLATTEKSQLDQKVARMLEKYVFKEKEIAKRKRVIDVGDINGETILHRFAASSMPLSVKALLENGAAVNAPLRMYQPVVINGRQMKKAWNETPLDAVKNHKKSREKHMLQRKNLSSEKFKELQAMDDQIIKTLERFGGVSTSGKVEMKPFNYESDIRDAAYWKALREA